ncbi:MAG: hypothetical protein ABIQ57_18185 [Candidatus Kapaibacterium sp.]
MMRSSHILLPLLAFLALTAAASAQMGYQTAEERMTPKKRELYFYGLRAYPFGKIPQHARLDAIYRADARMHRFRENDRSVQSLNAWVPIGPAKVGGRVRSVVTHPSDSMTVWIGAADGGVWKTTDRGANWIPLMDDANAIAMGAVAVDPNNTAVIYAGTGEMSSNVDAYSGAGIMKTVDGGATWRAIGLTTVGAFSRIIVHPNNSNLVFAGATRNNRGFYRSADGGNTWSRTFIDAVSDVAINPADPSQVWIGTVGKGPFRSIDGGLTFIRADSGITQAGMRLDRMSLVSAPSLPSTLYALSYETNDFATDFTRIYKSTDAGISWTKSYDGPNIFGDQGWYNNVIAVSPANPDIAIAAGQYALLRTTNGGTKWTQLNDFGLGLHDDHHAIAFDPANPGRIYLGNDGGMYRSEDGGSSWTRITSGLAITQFYAMAIDQSDPVRTYGGTQDNGTVSTTSPIYGTIQGGDGFFVAVDPRDPGTIYAEDGDGTRITRHNGGRDTSVMNGIDTEEDTAAWSAPIVIDPKHGNVLWHGRRRIYKTTNRGDHWDSVTTKFRGFCTAIGISPANTDIVYAGSANGELTVTRDGGAHWADYTHAPGMPNRAVTDFAPSPSNEGTAYMSTSGFYTGHVFRTTDYGATWLDVSAGLPDIPVNALAVHPDDDRVVYAGSDIGMFITTDGGASWFIYNNGLPRVAVADLEIHGSSRTLRLASHGRSMWEIPLEKPVPSPAITSPVGGETWMGRTSHVISWIGMDDPAGVRIEYSYDDGGTWHPLRDGIAGTSFLWSIEDTSATLARIRVTAMGTPAKTATSRSFTIVKYETGGLVYAGHVSIVPYGLALDGDYLWSTDFNTDTLWKLDRHTLAVVGTVKMNLTDGDSLFTDMAYVPGRGHFYIHKLNSSSGSAPGGWLYEVDKNGRQIGRWESPCAYPIGLAWLGNDKGDLPYLLATDRNASQNIFLLDTASPGNPAAIFPRAAKLANGPRGATQGPDGLSFYQAMTTFDGSTLRAANAVKMLVDEKQQVLCSIPLNNPYSSSGIINARGIEFDPTDSNLWISDFKGNIFKIVGCEIPDTSTGPGSVPVAIPAGMRLEQNQPNPFSGATLITFSLATRTRATIALYDETGREMAVLADGLFEPGEHQVTFEPAGLPSGVYRYTLRTEKGMLLSRSMVYLR